MSKPTKQVERPIDRQLSDDDFIANAIRLYWQAHHVEEPTQYFSVREAFQTLRDITGLTRERIAAYLGITTGYLGLIESGKRLVDPANYSVLKELAKSYTLPKLVEFFDACEYKAINAQGASTGRRFKHGNKGAMSDWRDMMGE